MDERLARIEETIGTYLPALVGKKTQIVLDTGTLVGETIDQIDAGLATNQSLKDRRV
jgi:hypothetical protein